jgi:hypothetical protein
VPFDSVQNICDILTHVNVVLLEDTSSVHTYYERNECSKHKPGLTERWEQFIGMSRRQEFLCKVYNAIKWYLIS